MKFGLHMHGETMPRWGIPELDEVCGEIPSDYVILFEGPPGAGKTTLILHLVKSNAEEGRKIYYLSLNESPKKLVSLGRSVGVDISGYVDSGRILVDFPVMISDEEVIEYISGEITRRVLEGYDMVVIDSVTPLMKLLENYGRKRSWLHTVLYRILSQKDVSLVLVADTLMRDDPDIKLLEYLADVVVSLKVEENGVVGITRSMTIKKFRARPTPLFRFYYTITPNGILILNYIRGRVTQGHVSYAKLIDVECGAAKKIFGPHLYSGTQVFIRVKNPVIPAICFTDYLQQVIARVSKERNLKVAVITYNPLTYTMGYGESEEGSDHVIVHHHIQRAVKLLGPNLIRLRTEPGAVSITELLRREAEMMLREDVGAIAIAGLEKICDVHGSSAKKFAILAINNMKSAGILGLRIYTDAGEEEKNGSSEMLTTYYRWSDIVLELYVNEEGQAMIKAVKTPVAPHGVKVLDEEFCKCVET